MRESIAPTPTPVPIPNATISIWTGNASVSALTAYSPVCAMPGSSAIFATNMESTMLYMACSTIETIIGMPIESMTFDIFSVPMLHGTMHQSRFRPVMKPRGRAVKALPAASVQRLTSTKKQPGLELCLPTPGCPCSRFTYILLYYIGLSTGFLIVKCTKFRTVFLPFLTVSRFRRVALLYTHHLNSGPS